LGTRLAGERRGTDRCSIHGDRFLSISPFREPTTAIEYVRRAFGEEDLVRCWFGEPVGQRDRAAVEYWAILRKPDGSDITIAGTTALRFDEEGLVVEHRDYWAERHGIVEPPAGWGR
jgi:hypothetical protein